MKKISIVAIGILMMASCGKRVSKSASVKNGLDTFSYTQGIMFASFLKSQGISEINFDALYRGLNEGLEKDSGYLVGLNEMNTIAQNYVKTAQKAKIEPLRKKAKTYMDGLAKQGFKKLPSGAYYKVIKTGAGLNARPFDTVDMNFTIKNIDGIEVLNSMSMAQGGSTRIPLSMMQLPPLEDVLELVPAGSSFDLVLPTDLYPSLSRFSKKFDDNYGISYCNFNILDVVAGKEPKK